MYILNSIQIASEELKNQFDLCLAVDDIYEEVKPFQKTLRKNMPNPKKGKCSWLCFPQGEVQPVSGTV